MAEERKLVHCYAEGRDNQWEAFCLDFDLAVQGHSFQEVYGKLNEQVELYLESAFALPEEDRARLLSRTAPFGSWLRVAALTIVGGFSQGRRSPERHSYSHRIGDGCMAAA